MASAAFLVLASLVMASLLRDGSAAPSPPKAFLSAPRAEGPEDHGRLRHAFARFERDFGKNYSAKERERRFAAFKANLLFVEAEGMKNHSYTLRLNTHSDVDIDDLVAGPSESHAIEPDVRNSTFVVAAGEATLALPPSVDWRARGAITPVLDQGEQLGGGAKSGCGSCWAFAATGAISAAWQIATGSLVSLSQQQFVDCTSGSCQNGGIAGEAMKYATSHWLCTRQSYPYRAMDAGTCHAAQCAHGLPQGSVSEVAYIPFRSSAAAGGKERMLMERLVQQPVAVALFASRSFQHYGSGVFDGPCGGTATRRTNHAVLFVGYGSARGAGYFLLKNSWGLTWGEFGYMKLARGPGSHSDGVCNSFTRAAYPVVSATPTTTGRPGEPSCCAGCPGSAFCSPISKRCYDVKRKGYYETCPRRACCVGCPGSPFCSPISKRCYDVKRKDYYEACGP